MLYHFLTPLSDAIGGLNVFRYISFRTGGALLTSLLLFIIFGRGMIDWMRVKQKKGQPIRDDGPARHVLEKAGTPTMGGAMILGALTISTLLWARLDIGFVVMVLFTTLGFGAIGFWDDYLKVSKTNTKGAPGKLRLLAGLIIALIAGFWANGMTPEALQYQLLVPFSKDFMIDLGILFIAVFVGALIGAGLGFLWFNAPPAMVFMGDTGSLALGGALGSIAVATKHEIVLAVIGGLFVVETLSVIIQVTSYKWTGKRVFRMAPIHHHFEQKGWHEPTIVIRFWIVAVILALIGLSTLKLR